MQTLAVAMPLSAPCPARSCCVGVKLFHSGKKVQKPREAIRGVFVYVLKIYMRKVCMLKASLCSTATMTRFIAFAFAAFLCSSLPIANAAPQTAADEAIFRLSDRSAVNTQTLLTDMQTADVVLLGEIHDNLRHHELRAQLLREPALNQRSVVAEHLDAGQVVGPGDTLLTRLEQAGFDAKGWQWPMHQPLFAAVLDQSMPLYGGNLPKLQAREAFKTRGKSLPADTQAMLLRAPLDEDGVKQLRHEIDEGHCGALPGMLFEGMMAVQRGRDAAMADQLMKHLPSVLLSGNGHAWKHLGVPQIIRTTRPGVRTLSLLLLEHEPFADVATQREWLQHWQGKADYVWMTPAATREDPCLSLQKK